MSPFPKTLISDRFLLSKMRFKVCKTWCVIIKAPGTAWFKSTLRVTTDGVSESCLVFTLLEAFTTHSLRALNTGWALLCTVSWLVLFIMWYCTGELINAKQGMADRPKHWVGTTSAARSHRTTSAGSSQLFFLNLKKLNPIQTTLGSLSSISLERTYADFYHFFFVREKCTLSFLLQVLRPYVILKEVTCFSLSGLRRTCTWHLDSSQEPGLKLRIKCTLLSNDFSLLRVCRSFTRFPLV